MTIFSEEGLGASWKAANISVDVVSDTFWMEGGVAMTNYWLGKQNHKSEFVIELGCSVSISGVTIRNAKNTNYRDRSTKKFSIHMAELSEGPWVKAMTGTLEDQRHLEPIPMKYFEMMGKGKFVKFKIEEFYGAGASLQFFDLHSYFFHKIWYKANNTLQPANCDHYTFNDVDSFR